LAGAPDAPRKHELQNEKYWMQHTSCNEVRAEGKLTKEKSENLTKKEDEC